MGSYVPMKEMNVNDVYEINHIWTFQASLHNCIHVNCVNNCEDHPSLEVLFIALSCGLGIIISHRLIDMT